ncbi:MAG: DUF4388 domain-containing protein [Egibacteraceae bacterium]
MLKGTLAEFSLQDLFGLLSSTRKTGLLHVQTAAVEGRIWLREGRVVIASTEAGPAALLKRLAATGVIDRARRDMLTQEFADASAPVLAHALASSVEEAEGNALLRELAAGAVQALLEEGGGSFSFDAQIETEGWADGVFEVDELMAEAQRRLEAWQHLRERVGPVNGVPVLRPAAADDREELTVSAAQWRLLARLDGRRDVAALSEFEPEQSYRVLAELLEAGLVELDAGGRADETLTELRPHAEQATPFSELHAVAASPFADLGTDEDAPSDERPVSTGEASDDHGDGAAQPSASGNGAETAAAVDGEAQSEALTRDQEIDRALVLRLIDGVKEA